MNRVLFITLLLTVAACFAVAQQTGAQSSASGGATAGAEKGAGQGQTSTGATAAGDVQTQQSPEGNKGRQSQPSGSTAAGASTGTSTSAGGSTSANAGATGLAAGTSLDAELTKSIDARKAKQGDPVEARVRNDVKQDGKVVIRRGSKLIGHVTQAQAKAKGDTQSALGIMFDRVQGKGGETMDVHAAIQAIAAPRASAMADEGTMAGGEMSGPAGGAGMPQGGGGALGGVGNTVGGAARTAGDVGSAAGQSAAGAAGAAGQTVGGAAAGAGSATGTAAGVTGLPGVQISNQLSNSTNGSVLVSNDKNLHLDSGTQMVLRVVSQ